MFVESYTGGNHNGPAWIGRAYFSKSGKTIYFNGRAINLRSGWEIGGDGSYWVSGVKKNGQDRHKYGPATLKVMIDETVVDEYLQFRELDKLPSVYEVVKLDNTIPKEELTQLANEKASEKDEAFFQNGWYADKAHQK